MREKMGPLWLGNVDHVDSQEIFHRKLNVLNVKKEEVTQKIVNKLTIWVGNVDHVDFQGIFPRKLNVINVKKQKVTQKIMNYLLL